MENATLNRVPEAIRVNMLSKVAEYKSNIKKQLFLYKAAMNCQKNQESNFICVSKKIKHLDIKVTKETLVESQP